jgi:pimeloyl-ACP methyl ester carboxylesterase
MALAPGTYRMTIDGVRQVYHVAGRGPVCVTHSGGPGIDSGYLDLTGLEDHFTVVRIEPVGTGRSGRLTDPAGYRMDTYVRFLAAVVDELGAGPVHVLGHSYGGCVAQRFALDHPDRVAGLVLYDSTPVLGPELYSAALDAARAYPGRFPDQPAATAIADAFLNGTSTDDRSATERLKRMTPLYLADYFGRRTEYDAMIEHLRYFHEPASAADPVPFDTRDRLAEITVPTLVLVGEHDFICGPRWARMLHDGIKGSELVLFPGSGHFPHLEEPEAFVRAVAGLLRHVHSAV